MATSKSISQLSILVQAQIAGAVKDLKDFESIGKEVGPSVARAFKNSTENVVEAYDKMLIRITRAFAQNNFSKTSVSNLDLLRNFYAEQEKTFGEEARVRAAHVDKLSQLFTQRRMNELPDTRGIGMPDATPLPIEIKNAFNRIRKIETGLQSADDVTGYIQKLNALNESLERMAARNLPMAASGLAKVNDLMQAARAIGTPNYVGSDLLPQISAREMQRDQAKQLAIELKRSGMTDQYGPMPVHGPGRAEFEAIQRMDSEAFRKMMGLRDGDATGFVGPAGRGDRQFDKWRTEQIKDSLRAQVPKNQKGGYLQERIQTMIDNDDMEGLYTLRRDLDDHYERKTDMGGKASRTAKRMRALVNATISQVERDRQVAHDIPFANAALPGVISQGDIDRDNALRAQRETARRFRDAGGNYSYTGGGLQESPSGHMTAHPNWSQTHYGPSPFQRRIARSLNSAEGVQDLRAIRAALQDKVAKGNTKLEKQLRAVDRALSSKRTKDRFQFTGSDRQGEVIDRGRRGTGRGSYSRSFRYVSTNMAYGAEDAIVSYGIGGVAGAARAATNNMTAVAAELIKNPMAAAGTIVGISVLGAAIPPMIKWYEEAEKGKDTNEKFMESYEKLSQKLSDGIDFEKLIKKGSADKLKSKMEETIDDLDEIGTKTGVLSQKTKEAREKQEKNGGYSKFKTSRSLLGFEQHGDGWIDDRLLTMADDFNWWMGADPNATSFLTGEKHGEFSRRRKEALAAEGNVEMSLTEKAKLQEEQALKEKQLKKLKERLEKRKKEEESLNEFKEGRGELSGDIQFEERFRGEKFTEAEFKDRLKAQKTARQAELRKRFTDLGMDLNSEEYKDAMKAEDKYFAKEEKEGVRGIRLREQEEKNALRQAEERRVFDNNRDYSNKRRLGEEGGQYQRWFDSKQRENDLMKMEPGAKRDALVKLNALDYRKGELANWEKEHPYQRKPFLEGVDANSVDAMRLKNHYSLGKAQDNEAKQVAADIKLIEQHLRGILGETVDRTNYKPTKG